jgi:hypothetical protein
MVTEVDWFDLITRFVLPPILGGIGGLIVIWTQWGIEKRRQRLRQRAELILSWRFTLLLLINRSERDWVDHRAKVLTSPEYSSLRSHLSRRTRKRFEAERKMGDGVRTNMIVHEVARIERQWKLV